MPRGKRVGKGQGAGERREGATGGAKERARVKKKKVGRWVYTGIVQPTDANENKELLPSSDFLLPLSRRTGWSRHVQSRKHSARNEKRIRKNSVGGGREKGRREQKRETDREGKEERENERDFRAFIQALLRPPTRGAQRDYRDVQLYRYRETNHL